MKLLTINTHSLIECEYQKKLDIFVDAICRIRPDIIAMQEVNQTMTAPVIAMGNGMDIRRDNHGDVVCKALYELGMEYSYIWQGIKEGYGKFHEGIALMSSLPIADTDTFIMSSTKDEKNWRCRRALGIKVEDDWFYSVHFGRYDDKEDPFSEQWKIFNQRVAHKDRVWVMGDFNCDADSDGYNEVLRAGWHDTFLLAECRDSGITVKGKIDGWRDTEITAMRIDYIFTKHKVPIKSSKAVFNGVYEEVVSDHYGVEVVI